jgi:mono/diheme cytochrome c family protein
MKAARSIAPLAFLVALPLASAGAQDVARGQALAERWCANCHVVNAAAGSGQSNGLPTFPAIAARPDMNAAILKGAMSATHSRMPDFELGARDQDDLAAYILSLRKR